MFERVKILKNPLGGSRPGIFKRLRDSLRFERDNLMMITLVFVFVSTLGVVWFLSGGTSKMIETASQNQGQGGILSMDEVDRTYVVKAQPLSVVVKASGVVRAVKTMTISSPLSGKIALLPAALGSSATTATVFAKLDTAFLQRTADQAKARHDLAQAEVIRLQQLQPPASNNDIIIAQMKADISKSAYEQSLMDIINSEIKFPVAGILDTINISLGQTVSINQAIGTMVDPNDYVIESWIPQADANNLKIDATATVDFVSKPGITFTAHIASIGLAANNAASAQGVGTIPILIRLAPDGQPLDFLRTGLFGASVVIANTKNVISVPKSAVIDQAGKKIVYIVTNDKRLISQDVKIGSTNETHLEIIDGLHGSEVIAINDQGVLKSLK